jgi:hypothetical protein
MPKTLQPKLIKLTQSANPTAAEFTNSTPEVAGCSKLEHFNKVEEKNFNLKTRTRLRHVLQDYIYAFSTPAL